jgi:hypothetical protein
MSDEEPYDEPLKRYPPHKPTAADAQCGKYLEAYLTQHIANLRTRGKLQTLRVVGRPLEPFKDKVRDKILAALARCSDQPRQVKVEREILKLCDDSIAERTARNWAKQFLEIDQDRRQKRQKGQ